MTDTQLGIGVMIQMLGGNRETAEAVQGVLAKTIAGMAVVDNELRIDFTDGTRLSLWDSGQSCCEMRWMESQTDNLAQFAGAQIISVEVREVGNDAPAPKENAEYGHDVLDSQFLWIVTTKGVAVFANYNDHNGYYGGFWISANLGRSDRGSTE
jgi:hypothetical protein